MKQNLVFKYFTEICKIPHVSGHEQKLALYIVNLLKKNKCKVITDKLGNIYASKNGPLKVPSICFQAHLDMVGEKTIDSKHNFKTDPIDYYEDSGWIKAKGTTLGADNGVGLALILALLTDVKVEHGPLEAVFTVEEETTTIGAIKLNRDWIQSPYLINVDSESDNNIIIGSGYCCDFNGFVPLNRIARKDGTVDLSVRIMNGNGGHSGIDIHKSVVNTVVEMFNILKNISNKYKFQLIDIKTSQQLNLIPPHCEVIINLEQRNVNQFKKTFLSNFNVLFNIYETTEKHLSLVINTVKASQNPLTYDDTTKLINLLIAVNNGLNNFDNYFGIPHTSTNLGQIVLQPTEARFSWLQRAANEYDINKLNNKLSALFSLVGGSSKTVNFCNGLIGSLNNRLALFIQHLAKEKFNHFTKLSQIHAVLEIGEIVKHYPNITAVSIGANIENPHTTKERTEIKSILYTYELIKEIVKTIK